nr:flocculation protein FLO11-like [Ipomoea batatas]
MPPSEPITRAKATAAEKGKGKAADATPDPTLVARFPSTGARHPSDVILEDAAAAAKAFIFRRLRQLICASNLQAMEGASPSYLLQSTAYHSFQDEVGRQYLLDLGEAGYDMGYQDAQKEIFGLLKTRDAPFFHTSWGLLNLITHDENHGAEDVALNASVDTLGGEIPMDNAYLESAANVDSIAGMDQAFIPTLTEVGRNDVAATGEEEDPSDALQLNRQRSRSSERNLLIGPLEAGASGIPQSKA